MNLVRATATIGGLTLVSRVLGFVRDMLGASFLGAGFANDAFLIAFRLPNFFRALFAEGAFAAAFVPMVSRKLGDPVDGRAAARAFAEQALSVLFPVLAVFTLVMMVFAGPAVWAMTGGFKGGDAAKLALATALTRVTFPYLMLISLVSLMGGLLNALGRFWVNAAAPSLLNLALIGGLVLFRGATTIETARTQAVAVTVAGLLQFGWLLWSCSRAGVPLRLRMPRITPEVRRLLSMVWPAALGAGALQFNLLVSTLLAARFLDQGAISYLYYADRLNQLPLGLVGIGVGTALLPAMSRMLGAGNDAGAVHQQNRAIELVLLLTLPAAAGLVVGAVPIIRALLEHGRFHAADTVRCAAALSAFSLGLPAYVLIKVLTPGFHARQDTRTPVRIAVGAMLVNLVGNLVSVWTLGFVGIALSTATAAWVNAGALWWVLRARGHYASDDRLRRTAPRLAGAALLMGGWLWLCWSRAAPFMGGGWLGRILVLAALLGSAAVVYAAAVLGAGAVGRGELLAQLRRRG